MSRLLILYVLILTICAAAVATLTPNDSDRWLRFAYSTVAAIASAIAAGIVMARWPRKDTAPAKEDAYTKVAGLADLPSSVSQSPVVRPPSPLDPVEVK